MGLAIGEVIGDYEVIGHLGAGGMGDVYKVRHVISERVEALKLLLEADVCGKETGERFAREIRVLARLQHPNIAALHTAFRSGDRLAMVMEYVEGSTLSAKMRTGVTLTQGLNYISQVLNGLGYAHKHGVVHRDIKPSNIIISADDSVKLVDFGIAVSGRDARMTISGQVVGSFHTMSPEQIDGSEVDARSDLYSVGCTLYEVITGKLPIEGPNSYSIMTGHLNRVPIPPIDLNPKLPPALSRAVMKALAKRPDDRYQSAEQLLGDLAIVQAGFGATMDSVMTVVTPSVRPSGSGGEGKTPGRRKSDSAGESNSALLTYHPAVIEEVGRELASYIGPIAKIIVKRAAKDCTTVHDLFVAVAQEIDSSKDREKFMAARRRYAS